MNAVAAAVCGVSGLLVGSWLHVAIRRTPMHQSLRRLGQHCARCGVAVAGRQRVALLATITRHRHCTTCGNDLWPSSPWVELGAAVLLAVLGWSAGFAWALPAFMVFFLALLVITIVDLRLYVIPNRVVYPALFICIGLLGAASLLEWSSVKFVGALLGMAVAWIFFFVIWFVYPRGMGFGDVRLSALVGLLTGWIAINHVVIAIILGLVLGAVCGILLMAVRLRGRKDAIPFGPFLAAGAVLAVIFGDSIVRWWLESP